MTKEIKEAKSLRWLANQFPLIENPKDDADKMVNCIHIYCTAAADRLEQLENVNKLQAELEATKAERDEALRFIKELFGCGDCVYGRSNSANSPCDKCKTQAKATNTFPEWKWRGMQS